MKIEIIKGTENPVAEYFSSPNTPETNKNVSVGLENADRECVPAEFARRIEQERDELRRMSVTEMMGHNLNVKHHVTEWENRCLKAEQERDEGREQNTKLLDKLDQLYRNIEIDQLKEGAK